MNRIQTCKEELLVLYHYDELSATARRELAEHLRVCRDCQEKLAELQSALAAIPRAELRLSPAQKRKFSEQVTARIQRRPAYLRAAWVGALATTALVAGIMLLRPADAPSPAPSGEPAMAEFEMLEQIELLQELELLKDLDLLQEMEQLG